MCCAHFQREEKIRSLEEKVTQFGFAREKLVMEKNVHLFLPGLDRDSELPPKLSLSL